MKEKSISDDADELFYINIALVFANSINVFARMSLHEFFCHKKRSPALFQWFDLFHHDTHYFILTILLQLFKHGAYIMNTIEHITFFSKLAYVDRSFLSIFNNN